MKKIVKKENERRINTCGESDGKNESYESLDEYLINEIDRQIEEESKRAEIGIFEDGENEMNEDTQWNEIFKDYDKKDNNCFIVNVARYLLTHKDMTWDKFITKAAETDPNMVIYALETKFEVKELFDAICVKKEKESLYDFDSITGYHKPEISAELSQSKDGEEETEVYVSKYEKLKMFFEDEKIKVIDDIDIWYDDFEVWFINWKDGKQIFKNTEAAVKYFKDKGIDIKACFYRHDKVSDEFRIKWAKKDKCEDGKPYMYIRIDGDSDYFGKKSVMIF